MTPSDLQAWQAHMGYSYARACAELGVGSGTYARMLSGESTISRRTALACAALAHGLRPWTQNGAGDSIKSTGPGPT